MTGNGIPAINLLLRSNKIPTVNICNNEKKPNRIINIPVTDRKCKIFLLQL